jgi:hypothetical protein
MHGGSTNASKKSKPKSKTTDPNEASKLIAAKISQLELDAAGEKDQEAEIGAWFNQLLLVEAMPGLKDALSQV